MERGMLGIIVAGGTGPLEGLGGGDDAALTPFAGKYRFIDFALAALVNSGVRPIYAVTPPASPTLRAHLGQVVRARSGPHRPLIIPLAAARGLAAGRAARLHQALVRCRAFLASRRPETVIVLFADHVLQLDARQLLEAHRNERADLTLVSLPVPVAEATGRTVLHTDGDRVSGVTSAAAALDTGPDGAGFALSWAGDLVVSGRAIPALLAAAARAGAGEDAALLEPLSGMMRVVAYDVLENRLPGAATSAYWHHPTTVEAYYEAQMDLCTPQPPLDLYNPAWPVAPVASGLGPAKLVADGAGRPSQVLNSLLSDGALISGGAAINTVLGHGVVIESMAEVEDSVLLDGCRIGCGARVRRAVVAAGASVADGEEIGYGGTPLTPSRLQPSGLTLVLGAAPPTAAAAASR